MSRSKPKVDSIPLPFKSRGEVQKALAQMQSLSANLNAFVGGIRTALNIPEDWAFNPQSLVFEPRRKQKGAG